VCSSDLGESRLTMRTRAQTSNTTIPEGIGKIVFLSGPNAGVEVPNTYSAYTYQSLNETITDQLMMRQASGYCSHSRVVTWAFDQTFTSQTYLDGAGFQCRNVYDGAAFIRGLGFGIGTWDVYNPTHGFDWRYASYSALEAMKPSFQEMLLPNFLKELASAGSLLGRKASKKLKEIERRRIRDLQKRIRDSVKPKRKLKPKDVVPSAPIWDRTFGALRKMANKLSWVNLAWQFAVQPTLADAKAIGKIIDQYKSSLSELIRKAGILQRRHYKRPCDIISLPARVERASGQVRGQFYMKWFSRHEWNSRPMYHASCLFDYDASRLHSQLGRVESLIHSFGVSKMASVLWEAIPYSFVVDWFVGIGDLIDSLEDSILDPLPIVIHDFSHSLKYEYKTILEVETSYNGGSTYSTGTDYYMRRQSVYERRRDVPSLWDSLSARSPNLNKAGLGLSIIVLQMDGVNRRKLRKK
jgi:hypothetical protein